MPDTLASDLNTLRNKTNQATQGSKQIAIHVFYGVVRYAVFLRLFNCLRCFTAVSMQLSIQDFRYSTVALRFLVVYIHNNVMPIDIVPPLFRLFSKIMWRHSPPGF